MTGDPLLAFSEIPIFRPLTGLHEPSAIHQLADGRFIVVEDEQRHPLSLVSVHADHSVTSTPPLMPEASDAGGQFAALDDLEGVTVDPAGYVYATGSHSRNSAGDESAAREKLVRFRIEGNRVIEPVVCTRLKPALTAAHPILAAAAAIREVKQKGGLNIEALEMTPDQRQLMVGFRSPLENRRAIVAFVENPQAVFASGAEPRVAITLATLDLEGNGIRGMAHIPSLEGYLVIGGPVAREQVQFALWFWRGGPGDPARRVVVPGLPGFAHAEGVSPALIDGRQRIIIVSDDGSRQEGRCARFLIIDPEQLQIAS